jgi:outer membrane protein OmpA-like peptidoglycan-associated protein
MKRALAAVLLATAAGCGPARGADLTAKTGPHKAEGAGLKAAAFDWEAQPALAASVDDKGGAPAAPIALTGEDGTALQMVSLKVSAAIEEPLAFTELRMGFRNAQPRTIEGRFDVTLPEGASVSRWAMRLGDGWQEGEVVPSEAATEAYESFLHRRVDPALLEKQAGSRFSARVFPIRGGEVKELILSYSQELVRPDEPYRVRIRGLPRLDSFGLRVLMNHGQGGEAAASYEMVRMGFVADRDLVVPLRGKGGAARAVRAGSYVVARVVAPAAVVKEEAVGGLLVLVDTSASSALGLLSQVGKVGALIESIRKGAPPGAALRLACFDQEVVDIYRGDMRGFRPQALAEIAARGALGASDIEGALRFAAEAGPKAGARYSRVVIVTDGLVSAGSNDPSALRAEAARLAKAGVERLDVIAPGGARDEGILRALVNAGLAKEGAVIDGRLSGEAIAARLRRGAPAGVPVSVPESRWVYPTLLRGLEPGEPAIVYADLPDHVPFKVVLGRNAGASPAVPVVQASRPLVERAFAGAQVRSMTEALGATTDWTARTTLKQQIVDLSMKRRVLSDFTSMLVLETERDYARFKIDRRALTDILEIGPRGLELIPRRAPPSLSTDPPPEEAPRVRILRSSMDDIWAPPRPSPSPSAPSSRPPSGSDARPGGAPGEPSRPARVMVNSSEIRIIQAVHFEGSTSKIKPVSFMLLDEIARVLAEHPYIKVVEVQGHTDNQGPAAENVRLSQARADAVRAYLLKLGVAPSRLVAKGYGEEMPIESNATERGRERNRRVAFRILRTSQPLPRGAPPHAGRFAAVTGLLAEGNAPKAVAEAKVYVEAEPLDPAAFVALGLALEAAGKPAEAARAFGSIIDLSPSRADLRRAAGGFLDRLAGVFAGAQGLALDTYRKAAALRPDHPSSHRLLAFALARAGKLEEAFNTIEAARARTYPAGRFPGARELFSEDLRVLAAAWIAAEPGRKDAIVADLAKSGLALPQGPSLTFVLTWETDTTNLDLLVRDGAMDLVGPDDSPSDLPSGGAFLANVRTGFGPEAFVISKRPAAYPYALTVRYSARASMGSSMGKVQVIEHDGQGKLRFEDRPFLLMTEGGLMDLGVVGAPTRPAGRAQ